MSSWNRNKRRAEEPVILNVYDMAPSNEYTAGVGLGVFHSGVEVHGVEYTFSGGSGVFGMPPKQVPDNNVTFRESVVIGTTTASSKEVEDLIRSMRDDWPGASYNVLTNNCNSFSNDFCIRLIKRPIPGWVNRLAYLGSFLSCILPPSMTGSAPVEGPGAGGAGGGAGAGSGAGWSGGSAGGGGGGGAAAGARRRRAGGFEAFAGAGVSLDDSSSSTTAAADSGSASASASSSSGWFSMFGGGATTAADSSSSSSSTTTSSSSVAADAAAARRERLAAAALKRTQALAAAADAAAASPSTAAAAAAAAAT